MKYHVQLNELYIEAESEQLAIDKAQTMIWATRGNCIGVASAFPEQEEPTRLEDCEDINPEPNRDFLDSLWMEIHTPKLVEGSPKTVENASEEPLRTFLESTPCPCMSSTHDGSGDLYWVDLNNAESVTGEDAILLILRGEV